MIVDLFLVYKIIKRLVKPFNEWDAFALGIIDEKGNVLKNSRDFTTRAERDSWTRLDIMIKNLKVLLGKVPGGQTKLASYAAALWLIKEGKIESGQTVLTESDIVSLKTFIAEEAPTNNAGGGNIAAIGVGPDGEPPVKLPKKKKKKKKKEEKECSLLLHR